MPSERENETRQIIDQVMGSSVNWPANFKKVLPAWLEISQPAFHLNQLLGWQSHIGNNGSFPCTSPLSLTTAPTLVTGMETTLYSAGTYLITGFMEADYSVVPTGNTGATFGGASANGGPLGGVNAWTPLANVFADDGAVASSTANNEILEVTDFFTVPADATVDGIAVAFDGKVNIGTETWHSQLYKAGVAVGTADTSSATTTTSVENHGGSTDLWGTTWTGAEISTSDFGVAIWGTAAAGRTWEIDYVTITAYLSNLYDTVTGYLYVDGVEQAPTIAVAVPPTSTASATWFVTTEADDVEIEFRAAKTYLATAPTVTTNSNLVVVRLS